MEEKQINKWLRRQFSVIGWALIVYYLIMNIMAVASLVSDMLAQTVQSIGQGIPDFVPDTSAMTENAWGHILAVMIGFVVLYAWKGWGFFKGEILTKEKSMTLPVFAGLLCLCVGAQLVNSIWVGVLEAFLNLFSLSALGILETVSGSTDSLSMFLYSALLAPVAEEVFFRGFVLRSLRPYGKRFAIFASALLFGLFHGNLLQVTYAFLIGLVLGYVTVEYSIVWAVALHMFNNLVVADLLSRATANLPEMTASLINLTIFGLSFAAGTVLLIAKRRELQVYHRSEWMDARVLKCFFSNAGVLVLTVMMVLNMLLMLSA